MIATTMLDNQPYWTRRLQRQAVSEMTRGPWVKLATSAAKAAKDIRAAQSKRERVFAQKQGCSLQPGAGTAQETAAKKGPGRPLRPILECGSSCFHEVPKFAAQASVKTAADGGGARSWTRPCHLCGPIRGQLRQDYAMTDAAAAFAAARGTCPPRASPDCATLKLTAAAPSIAATALTDSSAGCAWGHVDAHEALSVFGAPGALAVAGGSEAVFTDRMLSLRVALAGTRLVTMMPVAAIHVRAYVVIGSAAGADELPVKGNIMKFTKSVLDYSRVAVAISSEKVPGLLFEPGARRVAAHSRQLDDVGERALEQTAWRCRSSGLGQSGNAAATRKPES